MTQIAQRRGTARLLVIGAAVLWGTTGTAQALGPAAADPRAVGAVRIIVGGLALLALSAAGGGLRRHALRAAPRAALGAGALAVAAYQVCFFSAVARTGVAVGTVVGIGSAPAFTGIIGWLVRRERPEPGWGIATSLAVAGAALLVLAGGDLDTDPVGILLALGAGLSYAVYTVGGKHLLDAGLDASTSMAVLFAAGGVLLLPVALAVGAPWLLEVEGLAMVLWLGLGATAGAYVLFGRGLARLPASSVATLSLAEPLTAAALGLLVLGERPGVWGLAGGGLVLAGLVLLAVRPLLTSGRVPSRR
jgi:drug/metabolite transporter, DME family